MKGIASFVKTLILGGTLLLAGSTAEAFMVPSALATGKQSSAASWSPIVGSAFFRGDRNGRYAQVGSRLYKSIFEKDDNDAIIGRDRGLILLGLALLVNIWLFSIPPEYRRSRFCSEQEVIDYPGSKCITVEKWSEGIADYYKSGGGIKFDFSIEPK